MTRPKGTRHLCEICRKPLRPKQRVGEAHDWIYNCSNPKCPTKHIQYNSNKVATTPQQPINEPPARPHGDFKPRPKRRLQPRRVLHE